MANPVWSRQTYAKYTVALGAVDANHTTTFNVPEKVQTVSLITPTFATDATAAVEGLSPLDQTTWTPIKVATAPGTVVALTVPSASYVTFPATYFGTGTFRLVNVTAQTTTTPVVVLFDTYS